MPYYLSQLFKIYIPTEYEVHELMFSISNLILSVTVEHLAMWSKKDMNLNQVSYEKLRRESAKVASFQWWVIVQSEFYRICFQHNYYHAVPISQFFSELTGTGQERSRKRCCVLYVLVQFPNNASNVCCMTSTL